MDLLPYTLDSFSNDWIRETVSQRLKVVGKAPADLGGFERSDSTHFVMGTDKQGVLWTVNGAMIQKPAQYFAEVIYHVAAMQTEVMVHGGAISAVIDAFAAGCGANALDFPQAIATAEQTVKFHRPVGLETPYLLHCWHNREATPEEKRGYVAEIIGELVGEQGVVLAESRSTIVVPKASRTR